jgi:hypothetical protein
MASDERGTSVARRLAIAAAYKEGGNPPCLAFAPSILVHQVTPHLAERARIALLDLGPRAEEDRDLLARGERLLDPAVKERHRAIELAQLAQDTLVELDRHRTATCAASAPDKRRR